MIAAVTPAEAILSIRRSLRLPLDGMAALSIEDVAQLTRRAAVVLAPCPRHVLERAVCNPLVGLGFGEEALAALVASVVESLIAFGDLHETRTTNQSEGGRFLVRPAWPSFVLRSDKSAILLGVAGDDITALAAETLERIRYEGVLRVLAPEDVAAVGSLRDQCEMQELSEGAWLRPQKTEPAANFLARWQKTLSAEPGCGEMEELRVLEDSRRSDFYRDRWQDAGSGHDGFFVARRRQRFGDPIWCFVQLERGSAKRFVDLQASGDGQRPCDIAWRLQTAMEATRGNPQRYRARVTTREARLDFFAPIPCWSERYLAIRGRRTSGERALFTYVFDQNDAADERRHLCEKLWLAEKQETQGVLQ